MPEEPIDAKIRIEVDGAKELKADQKKKADKRGKEVIAKEGRRRQRTAESMKTFSRKRRAKTIFDAVAQKAARQTKIPMAMRAARPVMRPPTGLGPLGAIGVGVLAGIGLMPAGAAITRELGYGMTGAALEEMFGADMTGMQQVARDWGMAWEQIKAPFAAVGDAMDKMAPLWMGQDVGAREVKYAVMQQIKQAEFSKIQSQLRDHFQKISRKDVKAAMISGAIDDTMVWIKENIAANAEEMFEVVDKGLRVLGIVGDSTVQEQVGN